MATPTVPFSELDGAPFRFKAGTSFAEAMADKTGATIHLTDSGTLVFNGLSYGQCVDLGHFDLSGQGEAAAALPKYAGNNLIHTMHYTFEPTKLTALVLQCVADNATLQVILMKGQMYQRVVTFTDNNRTAVAEVGAWGKCLTDGLYFDAATRSLQTTWRAVKVAEVILPTAAQNGYGLVKQAAAPTSGTLPTLQTDGTTALTDLCTVMNTLISDFKDLKKKLKAAGITA